MSRFYVPREMVKDSRIYISGQEARHILNVMRLKVSDDVLVFDGTGKEYIGVIKEVASGSLVVDILVTRSYPGGERVKITLIQAIPKKEKMDNIVEKSTELGVSLIIPVLTERTIVNWDERKMISSVERWRRIALEASKQCGRVNIPAVSEIKSLENVIKNMNDYNLSLMAALVDDAMNLKDAIKSFKSGNIALAIGPEGDFTPSEISGAKAKNFKVVNLGPRVLKSDTAGLAALAAMNHEFE